MDNQALDMLEEIKNLNTKSIMDAWVEGRSFDHSLLDGRYLITFESGEQAIYKYKNGVSLGWEDV